MVGGVIAQCTGHVLVQTMVAQQVLYMVHMTVLVLFVIAIGDLLLIDQGPHLRNEEHMTNREPSVMPYMA